MTLSPTFFLSPRRQGRKAGESGENHRHAAKIFIVSGCAKLMRDCGSFLPPPRRGGLPPLFLTHSFRTTQFPDAP